MSDPHSALTRNAALSAIALLTSSATLVCCVLPAVLVALGAGAALAGLVTAVPQLIWLSEHKPLVFAVAGGLLIASGAALWFGRSLPCPTDPVAARTCQRLRRLSAILYGLAAACFAVGTVFAFVVPIFGTDL
jgi:hypothetical protein